MNWRFIPCILVLLFTAPLLPDAHGSGSASEGADREPTVTVVYDNRPGPAGLEPAWGFACIVEGLEKTILFDAASDGPRLLKNMIALGFRPQDIDQVVVSHAHGDHTAGLDELLKANSDVTVYLLDAFPPSLGETVRRRGATVTDASRPVKLCAGAMVTGEIEGAAGIPEQALLLSGDAGAAVITGCAHPGIVHIVERAKALAGKDVLLALGGFHLLQQTEQSVNRRITELKGLGVRHITPCHCSGDPAIELFAAAYGAEFSRCSVGTVITVGEMIGGSGSGDRPSE